MSKKLRKEFEQRFLDLEERISKIEKPILNKDENDPLETIRKIKSRRVELDKEKEELDIEEIKVKTQYVEKMQLEFPQVCALNVPFKYSSA